MQNCNKFYAVLSKYVSFPTLLLTERGRKKYIKNFIPKSVNDVCVF